MPRCHGYRVWFLWSNAVCPMCYISMKVSPLEICRSLTGNSWSHQHWLRWCLVAYSAPNHYLYPCWVLPDWTHRSKRQWNLIRAVTSTDFCNRLTVPPNSNRIRLTERFPSPYGALCFHVFTGSDSPPGPSRLSLRVLSLLVSNQTSFTQIKRQSKISICGVLMHKNQSLTWCHSPTVSSRIKAR